MPRFLSAVAVILPILIASLGSSPLAEASEESDWLEALSGPTRQRTEAVAPSAGVIRSDILATEGRQSVAKLRTHADANLRSGNFAAALVLLEKALELCPDDVETRTLHAQALQTKLERTHSQDPVLFNDCVKQWCYVLKNNEFLEDSKIAEAHLVDLTGKKPKLFGVGAYLRSVLKPEPEPEDSEKREPVARLHGEVILPSKSTAIEPVQVP